MSCLRSFPEEMLFRRSVIALESGGDGLQLCVGTGHWPFSARPAQSPSQALLAAEPDPMGQLVAFAC